MQLLIFSLALAAGWLVANCMGPVSHADETTGSRCTPSGVENSPVIGFVRREIVVVVIERTNVD